MQAVILAAGMGRRLKEHTKDKTKCMVKVGGMTLIERGLRILDEESLARIVIVTGYQAEGLKAHVDSLALKTPVVYIDNTEYENSSNLYSLLLAREYLEADDTLVIESDIIYEKAVVDRILGAGDECLTFVSKPKPWMDGSIVTLDKEDYIKDFIGADNFEFKDMDSYYKTVSMYKLGREYLNKVYLPLLAAYVQAWGGRTHYESALKVVAFKEQSVIKAMVLETEKWYEINDIQDMDIAETIFAEGDEKLSRYMKRFGGYWRYEGMYDFCYLVNPFFPNQRFMDEMKANFETLIREYPSGMAVNSLLAAKYFELRPEHVCVGNGTAELIKSLMENFSGKLGLIY
ncbi:MAG: NTP transferase domain-containing protein, partial [Lachnospiraceae bacterium]